MLNTSLFKYYAKNKHVVFNFILLLKVLFCICYVFVCFYNILQFSMRSRTPSLNGSLYSPYNSINRKVCYYFVLFLFYILAFRLIFNSDF